MVRALLLQVSALLVLSSLVAATPRRGPRDLDRDSPQAALKGAPQAHNSGSVEIEHRSMDELYKAAMKETGTLTVSWGGDGTHS